MADTVESLRTELNALRQEFEEFKTYAKPVIDDHQPGEPDKIPQMSMVPPALQFK